MTARNHSPLDKSLDKSLDKLVNPPDKGSLQEILGNDYTGPGSKNSQPHKAFQVSRLVVLESVYCQPVGQDAVDHPSRYEEILHGDEQTWVRYGAACSEYKAIETGWLQECSILLLENKEKFTPTPDKLEDLFISFDGKLDHLLLSPGRSMRIYPLDLTSIYLRSSGASCKYCLKLFSR